MGNMAFKLSETQAKTLRFLELHSDDGYYPFETIHRHTNVTLAEINALFLCGYIQSSGYDCFKLVWDVGRAALAAIEAQQHAEAAPSTPAQVDTFLFGKDVDCKQIQAHELHESDGTTLDDKDARIRQLEAIIASHQNSLLQEARKSEQLQALLSEVAQVIAPVAETSLDNAIAPADSGAWLYVSDQWNGWNQGGYVRIDTIAGSLTMGDLRAIAEIANKLDAALKTGGAK